MPGLVPGMTPGPVTRKVCGSLSAQAAPPRSDMTQWVRAEKPYCSVHEALPALSSTTRRRFDYPSFPVSRGTISFSTTSSVRPSKVDHSITCPGPMTKVAGTPCAPSARMQKGVGVGADGCERIAVFREKIFRARRRVAHIRPVDRRKISLRQRDEMPVFLAAGRTPGRPDIENRPLAREIGAGETGNRLAAHVEKSRQRAAARNEPSEKGLNSRAVMSFFFQTNSPTAAPAPAPYTAQRPEDQAAPRGEPFEFFARFHGTRHEQYSLMRAMNLSIEA